MLELKGYQERSLEALANYFRDCAVHGAKKAFVLQTGRPYLPAPKLPELPYVCLRVPTGGGKTFMACHALGLALKTYMQADGGVCLWLAPSNTIREQTLAALQNRQHLDWIPAWAGMTEMPGFLAALGMTGGMGEMQILRCAQNDKEEMPGCQLSRA